MDPVEQAVGGRARINLSGPLPGSSQSLCALLGLSPPCPVVDWPAEAGSDLSQANAQVGHKFVEGLWPQSGR